MQYRKLIKFGDSSFVISLPKNWVESNSLKKGDSIAVEIGANNELHLLPKSKPERELTEITINLDELPNMETLKTFIISAYLKNFDTINIIGKDLVKSSQNIREYYHKLASTEIVEQNSKKIIARCFLDASNLSVSVLIRRMDVMTRSMLSDAGESMVGENLLEYISQKDGDVTRLAFLIFKTLRKALNEPELANVLKIEPWDILQYWNVVSSLQSIADQTKRICVHLKRGKIKNKEKLEATFLKVIDHYSNALKSHYTADVDLAMKVIQNRLTVMNVCMDHLEENMDPITSSIVEKMRNITTRSTNIARITLDK